MKDSSLESASEMLKKIGLPRSVSFSIVYGAYSIGVYVLFSIIGIFLVYTLNPELIAYENFERSVISLIFIMPSFLITLYFLLIALTSLIYSKHIKKLEKPESYNDIYAIVTLLQVNPFLMLIICMIGIILIILIGYALMTASGIPLLTNGFIL